VGHRLEVTDVGDSGAFSSPTLVRFGLTERLEARLASSLLSIGGEGATPPDLSLGGKLQLVHGPRLTLGPSRRRAARLRR
jgi:hypothetical protein